jgi:hypothetical protein
MSYQILKSFLVAFLFLLLSGCGGAPQPSGNNGTTSLNVNETINSTDTIAEPIYLNNCGSSANAEQVSEHSQTISIEGAAQIGVSVELAQASVAGKYVTSNSVRKSQTVIASPGTNMKFVLLWTEQVNEGAVTVDGYSGQATYRVSVPISVEQVSAENLGCSNNSTNQTNSGSATEAPSVYISPTSIPPSVPQDIPDTPPNTILEVGQKWRQGGLEIILKNVGFEVDLYSQPGFAKFELYMTNDKAQDITVKYDESNFMAVDNRGRSLPFGWIQFGQYYYKPCEQQSRLIKSGEIANLSCGEYILVIADIADTAMTEVIITVNGISSIQNARWRIPIYH